ncbi:MAG: peptide chain release factor N(5)-glutamine methyltransferase [Gemmatimonadetes bacterium]|nr:peptide chain release factor N(5)-glutamine methyltransferase [Gemmatimonadota bacterium]
MNGVGVGAARQPEDPWTVLGLVLWSADYLKEKGVEHARLDAEHLLAHALGSTRLQLYLQFDRPLDAAELAAFKPLLQRRARREPLQYVVGRAAFRHLDLAVDPRVLIPRPETEVLVDAVLEWARARGDGEAEGLDALDLGTGSGCIALALLTEGSFRRVVATDASVDALVVAGANAATAGVASRWDGRLGRLFEPLATGERFHVVVSNPPYVARSEAGELDPEVRDWEPAAALFGGPEGLDVLDALVAGAGERLNAGGLLALEIGLGQADRVAALIRATGAFGEPRGRRDLTGRPRILLAERG